MYIYKTICLINNKIYIGQSSKSINDKYLGSGTSLCLAIKKYGKDDFVKEILRVCETQHQLNIWEQIYIKRFDTMNREKGYNLCKGGQGEELNSPMFNDEIRLRMKATKTGKNTGKNNPNFGKKWSDKKRLEWSLRMKEMRLTPNNNFVTPPSYKDNPKLIAALANRIISDNGRAILSKNMRDYNLTRKSY